MQSNSTSLPQNQTGKKYTHTLKNTHERHTVNRIKTCGNLAIRAENNSNIYFYLFATCMSNDKTEQNRKHNSQLLFS